MKKILITGSTGMVGKNVAENKKAGNYVLLTPNSKELNLLNKVDVTDYLNKYEPDIVVHCAGVVGGIQANIANPVRFLVDNTQMGLNLIVAARDKGIKKLINLSSSCMYPRDANNPLSEENILQGELEPTNEGYALAKIISTKICEYINKEDDCFDYKTIIPCNLYGKYDKFDASSSHMLPAVIKKIEHAKSNDYRNITIWGDGTARREFMYVEDLADFIYYALENYETLPQKINVGLGYDYTINEYYQVISKVIGYEGNFEHDLSKPVGMKQKLIDDKKLKVFGWQPKTSLEHGIQETYKYYLEKVKNVN